jgi:hypothetical protein
LYQGDKSRDFEKEEFGMYRFNTIVDLPADSKQSCKFVIMLLVLLTISLFSRAAEARTDVYTFVPDQSTVVQTGGFAGVHEIYQIEGQFRLSIDFDTSTASFVQVDANLLEPSGFLYTQNLDELFNMTELVGTVVDDTTINFEGKAADDTNTDVRITLTFADDSVRLIGETIPPPNSADFFIYNLDAVAQRKFAGGTGEPNNPYQITTSEQLISIGDDPNLLNKHYVLVNDIDLDPNLPSGQVFTHAVISPDINDVFEFQGTPFTGVFDGDRHVIFNLTIDSSELSGSYLGLFGCIGPDGRVYNLGLENTRITVSDHAVNIGGLAGCLQEGKISSCSVTSDISGMEIVYNIGGLIGYNNRGKITLCYASGSVSIGDYSSRIGGLVGYQSEGSIVECHAENDVSVGFSTSKTGGLVGENSYGYITRSYCNTNVSGGLFNYYIGGLVGSNDFGNISNSFTTGTVSGDDHPNGIGGLVGYNRLGTITGCHSTASISSGACSYQHTGRFGGLVGYNDEGLIASCYATGDIICGNIGWYIGGFVGENKFGDIFDCHATGSIISGQLSVFLGGFAGLNHGYVFNCYTTGGITSGQMSIFLGGFAGLNKDNIMNCYAIGNVSGEDLSNMIGGLVGSNGVTFARNDPIISISGESYYPGIITNCYATGDISVSGRSGRLGGLVGLNDEGSVKNCYATGGIEVEENSENLGGLIGGIGAEEDTIVTNSYFLRDSDSDGLDNGFGFPLTDEQMKQQASFVGWDFDEIWMICEGTDYPRLQWQNIQCGE